MTVVLAIVSIIWSYSGHDYRIRQLEILLDRSNQEHAKTELVEQKFDMVSYQIGELGKQVAEMKGSVDTSRRELTRAIEALLSIERSSKSR